MGAIDWKGLHSDAKAASILIPDGEYPFECVSTEAKLSNSGSPQIVADFLCKNEKYGKRTVRHWFTLTQDNPTALDIWFRTMAVFGMGDAFWDKDPDMEDIAEKIMGQTVICSIKTDSYNGQDRNKISFFKRTSAGGAKKTGPGKGAPAPAPAAKRAAPAPRPSAAKTSAAPAADNDEASGYSEEPPF
jgi:uncharacterized protein DUF669